MSFKLKKLVVFLKIFESIISALMNFCNFRGQIRKRRDIFRVDISLYIEVSKSLMRKEK